MPVQPYRPVALMLLCVQLAACASRPWRPVRVSPRQYVEEEEPAVIRATLLDGTEHTLLSPVVRGDSIASATAPGVRVAIEDIRTLEVGRATSSSGGGGGLSSDTIAVLGLVVALGIAIVATISTFCIYDCP